MRRRIGPSAVAVPLVLGLLLLAAVGYAGWSRSQAQSLEDFGHAPEFALTDQMDRPLRADTLRGKVVVANFVYTSCPDICPLLSMHMKSLQERLRQAQLLGGQVQLVSFTTDPARDTPPVLREYAARFGADPEAWRFLTGPEDEVRRTVEKGFFLAIQPVPARGTSPNGHDHGGEALAGYEVMHSGRFALIDRQGRVRAWYDGSELDTARVLRDVQALLR
jgi:protein SCO1